MHWEHFAACCCCPCLDMEHRGDAHTEAGGFLLVLCGQERFSWGGEKVKWKLTEINYHWEQEVLPASSVLCHSPWSWVCNSDGKWFFPLNVVEPGCPAESQNQPGHSMSSAGTGWNKEVEKRVRPPGKPSDFSNCPLSLYMQQANNSSLLCWLSSQFKMAMFCI